MAFIGAPSPAKSSILTTIEPNRRQYLGDGEQTVFAIDYYENFVLVFQNGIKLTENLDYEIGQDGKHVRFIVAPEMNDTIDLYGTIDIANTENRTIYSNTSFTNFTSLTDVDTLSATDNQVLTTDANGYFYFRNTTLNELTDVNPTVNFAQYLTGNANGYFFANTEFKNLVDLNPSVSPAQYLTGNANGFFFANTRMRNLEDLNTSMSSNQYLTGNANGYFFANTEFKNLVDVNPTANSGQILVADGSGNFSFEDQVTSLADFDMTSMANNSIDANKLVDGSLSNTNFTDNTISGTKLADASVTEAKISGTISGAKLEDSSVPLSKLSGSVPTRVIQITEPTIYTSEVITSAVSSELTTGVHINDPIKLSHTFTKISNTSTIFVDFSINVRYISGCGSHSFVVWKDSSIYKILGMDMSRIPALNTNPFLISGSVPFSGISSGSHTFYASVGRGNTCGMAYARTSPISSDQIQQFHDFIFITEVETT